MSLGESMKDNLTQVKALYDSHVHWLMTGEKKSYFDLKQFNSFFQIYFEMFEKKNYRGDWIFGFGWNDSQLSSENPCHQLDKLSDKIPICFIKKDAHSCILNSAALALVLKKIESSPLINQFVDRDTSGAPTGVLKESAFYSIYSYIPPLSKSEMRLCLLEAQDYFLSKGFTHIRDMTCSAFQWGILKEMQAANEIKIYADINFNADTMDQAETEILPLIKTESQDEFSNLKIRGLKIFFDGSLGSKTALLFENYKGSNINGNGLWSIDQLSRLMKLTWQNNFEFSVHTLGDKAVDMVVDVARDLYSQKTRGYLNLEHVELVAPSTINKMKSLFVRCHMQPSHWLSDKSFIQDRLGPNTLKNLFVWEALRRAKVPISFGSDSPIEEADVELTRQALMDSTKSGIEEFKGDFWAHYVHPERSKIASSAVSYFQGFIPTANS